MSLSDVRRRYREYVGVRAGDRCLYSIVCEANTGSESWPLPGTAYTTALDEESEDEDDLYSDFRCEKGRRQLHLYDSSILSACTQISYGNNGGGK